MISAPLSMGSGYFLLFSVDQKKKPMPAGMEGVSNYQSADWFLR